MIINIQRGVREGKRTSPKLFILMLEDIFKNFGWDNQGVTIQEEHLTNLRFAHDIVIFAIEQK